MRFKLQLNQRGINKYFECIKPFGDMHQTKMDPQLFLLKLKSLNMVLSETIALENSINGVIAAKSAGLITKAVSNAVTSCFSFENADLTLSSLQEKTFGEIIDFLKNKDTSG